MDQSISRRPAPLPDCDTTAAPTPSAPAPQAARPFELRDYQRAAVERLIQSPRAVIGWPL